MKIGYIRVSTISQNIDRQVDALSQCGCEKIFIDKCTGTKANRPQLEKLFEQLRKNDIVIVTELSRFGRSTKDLINLVEQVESQGAQFISLKEDIDTTSAMGKFFFTIVCAFSQLQRDIIVQNTKEGLKAARARGRKGGRPKVDSKALDNAVKLYKTKTLSIKEIENVTGISKSSLYKYLNQKEVQSE
ncbi:recombinase family protein [Paludicola sp. MB14-C6]|uniref:recombinase family protein n=1 Tax=Paludihabitans sp. MB14-C6 TaxID=3070656 RepID=UPI0027DDFB8C|nr:recombinase family protein [Paludicola sp. MB14-C6]WMJ24329.1 recombinase family protein [Paludicola sp. MB14-C6]